MNCISAFLLLLPIVLPEDRASTVSKEDKPTVLSMKLAGVKKGMPLKETLKWLGVEQHHDSRPIAISGNMFRKGLIYNIDSLPAYLSISFYHDDVTGIDTILEATLSPHNDTYWMNMANYDASPNAKHILYRTWINELEMPATPRQLPDFLK
jgi:hypothetical protein